MKKTLTNIFNLIHSESHKTSYFKQVLFSYIFISCITFLIFSIGLLIFMQRNHRQDMENMNQKNIEQAYSFNTSVLQDISTYCYSALDSVDIRKLLYSDKYDLTTAMNSLEVYDSIQGISSIILSVDFVNFMTETVMTKAGRHSFAHFNDQELLSLLEGLSPRMTPYFCYPREIPYSNGSTIQKRRVISMIYYSYSKGALVVNLDYDTYCSLLNFHHDNNNFQMILVNSAGEIMAATDDNLFMCDFTDSALYQKINETGTPKGTFTYSDEGVKYSVAFHKASQMGITYISMYDMPDYLHGSNIFMLTLRTSIIYLIVTLLLSFFISYIIYSPIKKLKTAIRPSGSDIAYIEHKHKNDFEFLESVYKQLMEQNTALKKFKKNYTEEKQQKLLWTLMNDTGNLSVSRQDLESLDSCFEYLNYLVFIANIEFSSSEQDIVKDMPLFKFAVQNVTNELFENQASLKYIETVTSGVVFVGSFPNYDKPLLLKAALQIQQFFDNIGLFRLSFGFGAPVTELENLSDSYDAAKTALFNGRLNMAGCIQFYEDLQLVPPDEQHYPYETDQSILAALKAQNVKTCFSGVEDFFSIIQNYHYDQLQRTLSQLDASLQHFEYVNGLAHPLPEITAGIPTCTLDEIKAVFQERCRTDIEALAEIKTHSLAKTELISEVNNFIEENIYNPNLSVAMIAEKVDLSINYLRNIYKENTGDSLAAYIADRKLTLVCEMLSSTDISIQDISDKLGFTTKNYFFTFFKKHMNMTPTQYREQHSGK